MTSVFVKEWRQGHLAAVFGLLMGGLITGLWGLLTVGWVDNATDQENVNQFCGVLCYGVPLGAILVVVAGIIAAEVERGTAPLLLGLPFTRRQVWAGKLLAGLALAGSAAALVLVPAAIAMHPVLESVNFAQLAPDFGIWCAVLFCVALFASNICATTLNAILSSVGLAAVLTVGAGVVFALLGGRLTGLGYLLDLELWALAACPALLIGSYAGFARGETFRTRHRVWIALAVAAIIFLFTGGVLVAVARAATDYDRSAVERIEWPEMTGRRSAVSLTAQASPVRALRELEAGWFDQESTEYRSVYQVAVDLETGQELLARREAQDTAVSPDGRLAAVLSGPQPLTWRGEAPDLPVRIVEIVETTSGRVLYCGLPEVFRQQVIAADLEAASWSPDGSWLALVPGRSWEWGTLRARSILFMRADGSEPRVLTPETVSETGLVWDWAPSGDAVYYLSADCQLVRYEFARDRSEAIWSFRDALPERFDIQEASVTASSDGQWVSVFMSVLGIFAEPGDPSARPRRHLSFVAAADGSQVHYVLDAPMRGYARPQVWSWDARTLYVLRVDRPPDSDPRLEVIIWDSRSGTAGTVTLPGIGYTRAPTALTDGSLLLPGPHDPVMVTPRGEVRDLPDAAASALAGSTAVGLDRAGRLIVLVSHEYLAALDVSTGDLSRIYP